MARHSTDVSRPGEPAASWTFLIKPQEGGRSETPSPRLRMWEQGPEGRRAPAPRPAWPGPEARSLSCRVLDPAVSPRGERGTRNARGFEKRTAPVGLCRFAFAVAELREHSSRSHRDHSPGRARQFRGVTGRIVSPKTHVLRSQLPGLRKRLCSERRPLKR